MKFLFGIILGILITFAIFLSLPEKNEETSVTESQKITAKEGVKKPFTKKHLSIMEALNEYIDQNPKDAQGYLQKADFLASQGKYEEALPFYDKALYYDSNNLQAYMNRGAANYMIGNLEAAKRDFSAAMNIDSSKGENFFNRALVNLKMGNYDQAKKDFNQAAKLFEKSNDIKNAQLAQEAALAVAVSLNQKPTKNIKQQNIKTEKDTSFAKNTAAQENLNKKYENQLMTGLSNTSGMLEKFKEVQKRAGYEPGVVPDFEVYAQALKEESMKKFKEENSEKTFLYYKDLAYKKQASGDLSGALDAINKAIELNPTEPDLYIQRAQINRILDPKAALADYTKALEFKPNDASIFYNRALLLDTFGNKKAAKQDMQKALDLYIAQNNKDGEKQARAMQNLWAGKEIDSARQDVNFVKGANAFNKGNYKEALSSWDNLIKKYPKEASAYYNRAITNVRLNNLEAAQKDYEQVIRLNPNMPEALDGLSSLLISQGKLDEAKKYIDKSLKINEENPTAYQLRGFANMGTNPAQAYYDFNKAISYNAEDATSYFYRGILNADYKKNISAGIEDLKKAVSYGEKQGNKELVKTAKQVLSQLQQMQKN